MIGTGVREGGAWWPLALFASGLLLLGSSFTYADAFERFRKDTSESDSIRAALGPAAESFGTFSIVFYNLASIVVILVLCANMVMPTGSWSAQVGFTMSMLAGMSALALGGIDLDKHIVNVFTWCLVAILGLAALIGVWEGVTHAPIVGSPGTFMNSFWMFFFVLVGFDAIMKFTEETEREADIPMAFYLSNVLSILLTAGVALAIMYMVPQAKQDMNAIANLFALAIGPWILQPFRWIVVLFLLITTFVVFLATTRYVYGLGVKATNEEHAPWAAIATVFGCGSLLALLNDMRLLVITTDVGFAIIAALVASSAAIANWKEEKLGAATLSGMTAAGFSGLIASAFLSF